MSRHGVHWQQPLAGTLHLGRTNRWFLGGGKALLNTYYQTAQRMGIDHPLRRLRRRSPHRKRSLRRVRLKNGDNGEIVRGRAVVVAAGGFEANLEWLKRYWGDAADNFIVRGTPYNDGTVLANLLDKGAKPIGDPKGFHAIAVDARAPKYDGGIVTRLDAIPFGIVVNRRAAASMTKAKKIWPKRYAIWGGLIAGQPDQIAYCIVDAKTIDGFLPPMFKPFQADSLEGSLPQLDLDRAAFLETMREYNQATAGKQSRAHGTLDGVKTTGIAPPKSNWALPIDRPPFYALPLRPASLSLTWASPWMKPRA